MKGYCKFFNICQYWYICKGYFEDICQGGCGFLYDFYDEGNIKKIQRLGIERYLNGILKNIILYSFF